jgi:hypothetical protein
MELLHMHIDQVPTQADVLQTAKSNQVSLHPFQTEITRHPHASMWTLSDLDQPSNQKSVNVAPLCRPEQSHTPRPRPRRQGPEDVV